MAVIDDNILENVPKSQWISTVKNTISKRFSGGVPIGGRLIKVNRITRSEYTNSKYSKYLKATDNTVYEDKFKSANNLDDIILATTNYINEDLKHSRKDSFKEFARGDVLIRAGENDYSAKVIVGFTNSGGMVLYDVIDFKPTSIKIKKRIPTSAMQVRNTQMQEAKESGVSSIDSISKKDNAVNTNISEKAENDCR